MPKDTGKKIIRRESDAARSSVMSGIGQPDRLTKFRNERTQQQRMREESIRIDRERRLREVNILSPNNRDVAKMLYYAYKMMQDSSNDKNPLERVKDFKRAIEQLENEPPESPVSIENFGKYLCVLHDEDINQFTKNLVKHYWQNYVDMNKAKTKYENSGWLLRRRSEDDHKYYLACKGKFDKDAEQLNITYNALRAREYYLGIDYRDAPSEIMERRYKQYKKSYIRSNITQFGMF